MWVLDTIRSLGVTQFAIQIDPTYAEAYNLLGFVIGREGDLKAAIEQFNIALALKPDQRSEKRHQQTSELAGSVKAIRIRGCGIRADRPR